MRYASVCSGIEAPTVAWHPLGWEPVWFSEIEKFPNAVLKHHYPTVPNLGDMTKLHETETFKNESIELLIGGTPCQSFSVAGLRKGLSDPRGNLALTYLALADRKRPRWLIWENVPGVLSSSGGRDFGAFLGALGQLGYGFAYRVLDAQYFGVAQRRRRVFVIGYLGDWRRAAAVLFEPQSLRGDSAPSRQTGEGFAAPTAPSLTASGRGVSRPGESRGQDPVVAVPLQEIGKRTGISTTDVRAGMGIGNESDPMFTLQAGAQHGVAVAHAFKIRGGCEGGGKGYLGQDEVAFTVSTHQDQHIAFGGNRTSGSIGVAAALNAKGGSSRMDFESETFVAAFDPRNVTSKANRTRVDPSLPANTLHAQGQAIIGSGVRRLTPVECERLQGFPDGYTAVTYRSKPAADGPRYKALGNSMAVPVIRWLGQRIQLVEDGKL